MFRGRDGGCCRGGLYADKVEIGAKGTERHSCQNDPYICHMTITDVDDETITCVVDSFQALKCDDDRLAWYASDDLDEEALKNSAASSITKYYRMVKVGYDDVGRKLYAYPDEVLEEVRERVGELRRAQIESQKIGEVKKYKRSTDARM